jgi:hypothetical protein
MEKLLDMIPDRHNSQYKKIEQLRAGHRAGASGLRGCNQPHSWVTNMNRDYSTTQIN